MNVSKAVERGRTERAIEQCKASIDSIFDDSPVMMTSTVRTNGCRHISFDRVNKRFLEAMGYAREELLNHDPLEFMPDESTVRFITDIRPLLVRTGTLRGLGVRWLSKDGQNCNLLMDLDLHLSLGQNLEAFGTYYDPNDLTQWQQASTTLRALKQIIETQRNLECITLPDTGTLSPNVMSQQPSFPLHVGVIESALGALAETAKDMVLNLGSVSQSQEESHDSLVEQRQELISVVRNLDQSLAGLGEMMELLTNSSLPELLQAISRVGGGELSLDSTFTQELVQNLSQPTELPPSLEPITEREAAVLKLVAGGFSNKEIALKLTVTDRTVDKHVSSILGKLNVANRTQATLCALRAGLATLDAD